MAFVGFYHEFCEPHVSTELWNKQWRIIHLWNSIETVTEKKFFFDHLPWVIARKNIFSLLKLYETHGNKESFLNSWNASVNILNAVFSAIRSLSERALFIWKTNWMIWITWKSPKTELIVSQYICDTHREGEFFTSKLYGIW